MQSLSINLTTDYRSFKAPVSLELTGQLILLSGVNGSGKSQLIDIIKGYRGRSSRDTINGRTVTQNGALIPENLIFYKSFQDAFVVTDFTRNSAGIRSSVIETLHSWAGSTALIADVNNNFEYRNAIGRARDLIIQKYGDAELNARSLSRDKIAAAIPPDFILFQEDVFSNNVTDIFILYALELMEAQAEAYRTGILKDLPEPPWTVLNKLFEKLSFGYRFRDVYNLSNGELNEQPYIFPVRIDGTVDFSQPRQLSDLSDGEKAIISLTFAALKIDAALPKLLLLDEYDATLNPSLIVQFFQVVEEFFINKNVQVIIATHSSTTLSMAPDYTQFYEVFKPSPDHPRMLPVARSEYSDLATANRAFYTQISDQDNRIRKLESENARLSDALSERIQAGATSRIQIVSEGGNIDHIRHAISVLQPTLLDSVQFVDTVRDASGRQQMRNSYLTVSRMALPHPALFIWDCDAKSTVDNLTSGPAATPYCFLKNDTNTLIPDGIENLYDTSVFDISFFHDNPSDHPTSAKKRLRKANFLEWILSQSDPKLFANFLPLVERIKSLLESH